MPIWTPEVINLLSTANANWTKNYSEVAIPSMQCCTRSYTVLTRLLAESDITTALMIDNGSFQLDYLPLLLVDKSSFRWMHSHGAQVGL